MGRSAKNKAYQLGIFAEYVAIFMLLIKGYSILHRRYRCHFGEIDIIAKKGNTTVFCEVKARQDYKTAIESLSEKQKSRIIRSAEYYMSCLKTGPVNNKIDTEVFRCDMILVLPWQLPVHIKNAWYK